MNLEHTGFQHPDPADAAEWYVEHLGLRVVRRMDGPPFTHFLADTSGRVVMEIYHNTRAAVPDYANQDILVFHLAFISKDVRADRDRLVAAGATVAVDVPPEPKPGEDEVVTLRDPWGVPLQCAARARPMA